MAWGLGVLNERGQGELLAYLKEECLAFHVGKKSARVSVLGAGHSMLARRVMGILCWQEKCWVFYVGKKCWQIGLGGKGRAPGAGRGLWGLGRGGAGPRRGGRAGAGLLQRHVARDGVRALRLQAHLHVCSCVCVCVCARVCNCVCEMFECVHVQA